MDISLSPDLEQLVQEKVASGSYSSASEVIREALRLLKQRDELQRLRLAELKRDIARGIEAADRGELLPAEQVFQELRALNSEIRTSFFR
jgi:antitoxin ParD1/3/4